MRLESVKMKVGEYEVLLELIFGVAQDNTKKKINQRAKKIGSKKNL